MKKDFFILLFLTILPSLPAQQVKMTECADPEQIYGTQVESEELLPMNDIGVDFGYILYEAEITIETEDVVLSVENIRDYAVVYVENELQGTLTDNRKKVTLPAQPGNYTLQIYAENIGRITYGPEILDNSKGLFGSVTLDGEDVENWKIIELKVRDYPLNELIFQENKTSGSPAYRRGYFSLENPEDLYLDISGWGMGEAWINGNYIGSYWEEEKQQSLKIPAAILQKGKNEVIIFELKNNRLENIQLTNKPVIK